ncbi:SDR family oxidoreductase [uncultured Ruminococcus sp.]|uniref:elongation factor P 5-aminopentanone reductase n=1 Tax=uncultured Ruminococcus sp. TaxID=165186 RepID=UPI0025CE4C83|nr:SDR family oxidoreductase [uncultured Ruminococcus sp.]
MKTAVITGASGGIGSAIALAFASNNYNVVLQYNHNSKKAISLANKIQEKFNVTALAVKADVSSSQEVEKMFDFIAAKLGNVDVLINNAGIAQQKLFTDITDDDWHKMIGTNLDGVFYCCREVLKRFMIKNHSGIILNISSMWGQVGASCEVHYSAAKAGVIGLTKALAKEVGLSQIRVNCIAPGVVMTDMMKCFDEQTVNELKEETPLNTLGQPQDIADAALFLCSDKAKFITGQILGVNGGFII